MLNDKITLNIAEAVKKVLNTEGRIDDLRDNKRVRDDTDWYHGKPEKQEKKKETSNVKTHVGKYGKSNYKSMSEDTVELNESAAEIEKKLMDMALKGTGVKRHDDHTSATHKGDFIVKDRGAIVGRLKKGSWEHTVPEKHKHIFVKENMDELEENEQINEQDFKTRYATAKSPNATKEHISKALDDNDSDIRWGALRNPNVTKEHISKALDDTDNEIRLAAIKHPNATKEHISKALNDKHVDIRLAAIKHPNATKEHISKALNDTNNIVKRAARSLAKEDTSFSTNLKILSARGLKGLFESLYSISEETEEVLSESADFVGIPQSINIIRKTKEHLKVNKNLPKAVKKELEQKIDAHRKHLERAGFDFKESLDFDQIDFDVLYEVVMDILAEEPDNDEFMKEVETAKKKAKGELRNDENIAKGKVDAVKVEEEASDISEATLTDTQLDKREEIVKGMKSNMKSFKDLYGDNAKNVMYGAATKQAKKED